MVYAQFSKARIVWRTGLLTACCHLYITVSKEEAKSDCSLQADAAFNQVHLRNVMDGRESYLLNHLSSMPTEQRISYILDTVPVGHLKNQTGTQIHVI